MADELSYWQKRYLRIKAEAIRTSEEYAKQAQKSLAQPKRDITKAVDSFVTRYALENGRLDEQAAKKQLRGAELRTWSNTLDEWERKAKAGGYDQELNLEYYRSRVSRLKTLQAQMSMIMAEAAAKESTKLSQKLANNFKATYYRNIYTHQQQLGQFSGNFAKFDDRELKQVISKPWLGSTFSSRIWKNYTQKLPNVLTETLSRGIVLGYSTQRLVKMVSGKFMDVSHADIQRLIYTEMAHVSEEATAQAYEADGVEEYEYMATLETHTCPVCRALDGKIFKLKDKVEGVNYPVIHARCRCTTGAYYDDAKLLKEQKRWARNPETKQGELVSKMNYNEWLDKVNGVTPAAKPAPEPKLAPKPKPAPVVELMKGVVLGAAMTVEQADNSNANPRYGDHGAKVAEHLEEVKTKEAAYLQARDNGAPSDEKAALYADYKKTYDIYKKLANTPNPFGVNCQRATPAYELRRRGYDVEALAKPKGKRATKKDMYVQAGETREDAIERLIREGKVDRFATQTNKAWLDKDGKTPELKRLPITQASQFKQAINGVVKDGERHSIEWQWGGKGASGHIINMERIDGVLTFIDAQVGTIKTLDEFIDDNLKRIKPQTFKYLRLDDKTPNPAYIEQLMKGKETK